MLSKTILHDTDKVGPLTWDLTHEVKAILSYDKEDGTDPTSSERRCVADKPCRVFNCPFAFYPADRNRTCLSLADARSAYTPAWLDAEFGLNDVDYSEYFLNFGGFYDNGSAINNVKFVTPRALLRPRHIDNDRHVVQCPPDDAECQPNACNCTHVKQLPYNKTIQVFNTTYIIVVILSLIHI